MNVAHFLLSGAKQAGDGDAIVFGDSVTGYPELVDRVGKIASGLAGLGLRRGDRVALLLPNRPELVETLWACFWGGFVAVPLNWHLHPDEVSYVIENCGAAAVLVADETLAATRAFPAHVRVLRAGADDVLPAGADDKAPTGLPFASVLAEEPAEMADVEEDEPAWLFYTSGTTGKPKGATLSHANLAAMIEAYYTDLDAVAPGSVYLHAAPLTHGSGMYLLPATGRGATNVISASGSFSPSGYFGLVDKHGVTHAAFLAPTMLMRLVRDGSASDHDLTSLRSIVVGGAPFYQEDLRAAADVLGPIITQIYGQGECPMTITVMSAGEALRHPGSCGRPFTGIDLRIVGPDGAHVPDGAEGAAIVRGTPVMRGYWDNADATAATIVDGWLHTGDIGHLSPDGFLYLTDRAKDVIITGGSNVYPREVEEVLLTHPDVREVAVVGIPDKDWGESIRAVVVAERRVPAADLIEFCRANLASFKKPREVVFVDSLPKNAAGKILKRQLRDVRV